jgi:hypothetical protein
MRLAVYYSMMNNLRGEHAELLLTVPRASAPQLQPGVSHASLRDFDQSGSEAACPAARPCAALKVQQQIRERVWEAAKVKLTAVTLDTDTRCTRCSATRWGAKSYNPKDKGKKSYQPILTFLAKTREYIGGELRSLAHHAPAASSTSQIAAMMLVSRYPKALERIVWSPTPHHLRMAASPLQFCE